MTALAADRITSHMNEGSDSRQTGSDDVLFYPVAASVQIFKGAIVVLSGGYAQPGTSALGLVVAGCALGDADNRTGAAGAQTIAVRSGVFQWANSTAGDLIAQANVGALAWIVDDQTLALTNASGTRSPAGMIVRVDAQGVWVNANPVLAQSMLAQQFFSSVSNATGTFASVLASLATAARTVTFPDASITVAKVGGTPTGSTGTIAPAFTGTTPLGAFNPTPAFSGTGLTAAGQVLTSTDNQTMAINACAGMLLISATGNVVVIASNTAVTGAPAVFTVIGKATTDAGVYSVLNAKAPVGTVATHVHGAGTLAQV